MANYVLLNSQQLTASASSVTFSNIPQSGYTDLKVVMSARTNVSSVIDGTKVRFNNDTTSGNYTARRLYGDGTTAYSDTNNVGNLFSDGSNATANTFSNCDLYIPNYLSSNAKSYSTDNVAETNATTQYMGLGAQLWSGTGAINTITISPETGTAFLQYSTFSLYGLAAVGTTPAIAPKAAGGNIVANDGTYWYHAFTSSGYFTPVAGITCDVLQIAGGGAGGYNVGGGGGAGGLLAFTSQSLTATNYPVRVGAGSAHTVAGLTGVNGNGSNSQFGTLTASVGGGGGGSGSGNGLGQAGGSGGGGSYTTGGAASPSGQGNAGGSGIGGGTFSPGGGGGAGAVGANQSGRAGAGGAGLNTITGYGSFSATATATNTGVSGYYAGGGGGGGYAGTPNTGAAGGAGGGGTGSTYDLGNGTNGTPNTGGGGGGGCGGANANGLQGGSGIIIIRYAV
jgi:hypothetical protein